MSIYHEGPPKAPKGGREGGRAEGGHRAGAFLSRTPTRFARANLGRAFSSSTLGHLDAKAPTPAIQARLTVCLPFQTGISDPQGSNVSNDCFPFVVPQSPAAGPRLRALAARAPAPGPASLEPRTPRSSALPSARRPARVFQVAIADARCSFVISVSCLAFWFVATRRYACASLEGPLLSASATPPGISARTRMPCLGCTCLSLTGSMPSSYQPLLPDWPLRNQHPSGSRDSGRRPLTDGQHCRTRS